MLSELDAHRHGRRQIMQQYQALQDKLKAASRDKEELHRRCEELAASQRMLEEALAWATSSLDGQRSGVQETRANADALAAQLRESRAREQQLEQHLAAQAEWIAQMEPKARQGQADQEKTWSASLRQSRERETELDRQVQLQAVQISRQEIQVRQGEQARSELCEGMERIEQVADTLRSDVVRGHEAMASLRERDQQVVSLEKQLAEARLCLEAFSSGAGDFLRERAPGSNIGPRPVVDVARAYGHAGAHRAKLLNHFGGLQDLMDEQQGGLVR